MSISATLDFGVQPFEKRATSFTVITNGVRVHFMIPTPRSALTASVTALRRQSGRVVRRRC